MALKRNLIANYLGQGWAVIMGLAFIPIYIKYLGIESYGLIGLFALFQAWLILLDMKSTSKAQHGLNMVKVDKLGMVVANRAADGSPRYQPRQYRYCPSA